MHLLQEEGVPKNSIHRNNLLQPEATIENASQKAGCTYSHMGFCICQPYPEYRLSLVKRQPFPILFYIYQHDNP